MKLVIVSGLSGAGKTVVLHQYEDLGYYCIDNLPLGLLSSLSSKAMKNKRYQRLAVGVDARATAAEIARVPGILQAQRKRGVETKVVFLTADDDVILRRYGETRRKHPLTDASRSLVDAIQRERRMLKPIAAVADVALNTSALNLHELRQEIRAQVPETPGRLSLVLMSFGYKNGAPDGADYIFDVRCLPNPHWSPKLRRLDGRDEAVASFLEKQEDVADMTRDIKEFLEHWLPKFKRQDRAYVTVALGCTGGQHRSVYLVEKLARAFRGRYDPVIVRHKELA